MNELAAYFTARNISTGRAPARVLRKARCLVDALETNIPYWKLCGKRMMFDRRIISIPVGRNWRLLAEDRGGLIVLKGILSHEQYNHII